MGSPSIKRQARQQWKIAKAQGYEAVVGVSEAEVIDLLQELLEIQELLKRVVAVNREKRRQAFDQQMKSTLKSFQPRKVRATARQMTHDADDDDLPF
jgi:hypothetical protein